MKPATSLPWSAGKYNQWVQSNDGELVASVETEHNHGPENAAYIAHAANAYPKLVEALKNIAANEWDANGATATGKSVRALLREVGEAA